MTDPSRNPDSRWWPVAAFGCYALAYFALLYHPLLLRFDDFGYVNSVLETLQAGQPRTGEWLEPYSATLSALCSLAFRISGDFPKSTWGLQAVFVLINFALAYRLLRLRLRRRDAALITSFIATQPIYWYKCAEFGGNSFTFTFVLLALHTALRKQWIPFYAAAFLAFANRQNNVALLILPAFDFLRADARTRKLHIACFAAFAGAALWFHAGINRTFAQANGIYAPMDAVKVRNIVQSLVTGVFVGLAFLSFFEWLLGSPASNAVGNLHANLRRPLRPATASMVFLALPLLGRLPLIEFQAPFIGSLDHGHALQYAFLAAAMTALWILDWDFPRRDAPFFLGAGYLFINGFKGLWYDIYLLDVGLAALVFVLTRNVLRKPGPMAWAMIMAALLAHAGWAYAFKIQSDKNALSNRVFETLERRGVIEAENMTDATFGYLGWKFFDHFVRHAPTANPSAFLGYVNKDRVVLDTELPWRRAFKRDAPPGARILDTGTATVGFFRLRYRVMDLQVQNAGTISPVGAIRLDKAAYRKRPMPLDKREWSEYINDGRIHGIDGINDGGAPSPP